MSQPQFNGCSVLPPGVLRAMPASRRLGELLSEVQTAAAVRRERSRADRAESAFCLVIFRLDEPGWRSRGLLKLARVVLQQVRATDEVGRYDRRSICAICPDTDANGALALVNRVKARCERGWRRLHPVAIVYTYPSDPTDAGTAAAGTATSQANGDGASSVVAARDGRVVLRPMHELLIKPTPLWKRSIDIAFALTGIILTAPAMIAAAFAIKLTSSGPVIFTQRRAGIGGKPFTIFKFRTMVVDAEQRKLQLRAISEQDGPAFKLKRDPRVTWIGRILRETSLDELPQLFNILRGDMSLVGPRPLPVEESDGCDLWHRRRLDVVPGLTCIWQVEGRSRVSFEQWMRMDMAYLRSRRLLSDVSLLARTIPAVLLRKGAS